MTRPTELLLILFVAAATAARLLYQARAARSTPQPSSPSNKTL